MPAASVCRKKTKIDCHFTARRAKRYRWWCCAGIFRAEKVKSLIVQHVPLRPLEPNEAAKQRLRALRNKIEFPPQAVQLALLLLA